MSDFARQLCRFRRLGTGLLAAAILGIGTYSHATEKAPQPVADTKLTYNQYIRPILSDNCFYCHGNDKNHRKSGLRLDQSESALKGGKSGDPVVVPGHPEKSVLIERINSDDPDDVMPPPETHKKLTAKQKQTLATWIAQGAEYEPFWAYVPPKRAALPAVKNAAWVRNPIDAFILHELDAHEIKPSPEADRAELLRRVSLDLIGLPPTPQELASFLDDTSPNAYGKQVDRLLASPHYGERMAVPWLDAVRFADTVGFHGDQNQNVYPYRDYVINAFNNNKPFDQFVIEQFAGDLLPHPTIEQRVATCFNRLNMMTREGGAQPKEYLAKYAADRVRTLGSAFLGSTLACCECHDHKFDPFTSRDFYSLAAFWDDVKQWGVYTTYKYTPNPELKGFTNDYPFPPEIIVDSPYMHARLARFQGQLNQLLAGESHKLKADASAANAFAEWRNQTADFIKTNPTGWLTPPVQADAKTLHTGDGGAVEFIGKAGAENKVALQMQAGSWVAIRLEVLPKDGDLIRGRKAEEVSVRPSFALRHGTATTALAIVDADADQKQLYANGAQVLDLLSGWDMPDEKDGKKRTAVYVLKNPIKSASGDLLVVSLPKNMLAAVRISVSPIAPPRPLDQAFFSSVSSLLATADSDQNLPLQRMYLESTGWDPAGLEQAQKLDHEILYCRDGKSPVMVTEAVPPKITHILPRGNWQDDSAPIVQPATPAFLPQLPEAKTRRLTRLDLAHWLVSPENPLVARTFVNRLWKQYFGNGLCNTVEDMGSQGEWPSHPELLDWLAVEFRESGWDVKHMVRLMVMSDTYRQSSNLRPELREIDPSNRLLASQNPRRLEAEFVRDNALAVSGLIDLDIGGPSCFPYQPAGYYANIQFPSRDYYADTDEQQYRRGVYMHWQRTFLHPMLANFDAPSREDSICTRNVSNTPQQALTLLNDPTFVEAARVLAEHTMQQSTSDSLRLIDIYQRVLCRQPHENEAKSLTDFLAQQRDYYRAHPDDAQKLLHIGNSPVPPQTDSSELAAWTTVCRVVLNLHESITRY